ncbi:LppX_LprAFG lipoprotein [Nocardia sp. 2]|uniref:LppX_LprAFG lipoprotein n=1 Tax=Nocardia acididurans TaxID=2802282 RepID=A0ABS1M3R7_9NOCA|nr:LppX_LprAFG lipoprotein [Nocardia acididurans]MBL1074976.1 LppX_LprAFG lipoprotein [Nocardia acididurans]
MRRRPEWIRRALLVVGLTVIVAACGDGSGGLPDAGLIMRDAAIASRHMKSAHIVLRADGTVPGFPFQRVEADVSAADGAANGSAATPFGQTVDFVRRDGVMYSREPDGGERALPTGATPPDLGTGVIARLLGELQDPRTVERGEFDGTDAFLIRARVPAETVAALLPTANTEATLSTWVRVRGVRAPLRTTLEFPGGGSLHIQVSRSTAPAKTTTEQRRPCAAPRTDRSGATRTEFLGPEGDRANS